jgi:hypothetical protein
MNGGKISLFSADFFGHKNDNLNIFINIYSLDACKICSCCLLLSNKRFVAGSTIDEVRRAAWGVAFSRAPKESSVDVSRHGGG